MAKFLWMGIPVLLMVLIWWSLYTHLLRMLGGARGKWQRLTALVLSGCIMLPACRLWESFYFLLLLLHWSVFQCVFDALNPLVRRMAAGREHFLRTWGVLHRFSVPALLCTAATALYGYVNINDVVQTEYYVSTPKAIRAEGYRIALIADVHYGLLDNREAVQALAEQLSAKQLDLVVLAGDIFDERSTPEKIEELCAILGGIRTTYGVHFVYGNHDTARYSGQASIRKPLLDNAMRTHGIHVLEDDTAAIGSDLLLVGRRDRSDARATTRELMAGADSKRYIILADHQPYELEDKAEAGIDLQLSGHTHSGQIFPVGYLCTLFHIGDQNYGHRTFGGMHSIVTSGFTGWGAPLRTQKHSEYVIIHLKGE